MTRTIVINLPHRTDRRREMEDQLSRIGWTADIFPAVRPPDPGPFPSIGARGCFLSHLAVLEQAAGSDRLIILEDDLNFVPDFRSRWTSVEAFLATNEWDIFYPANELDISAGIGEVPPNRNIVQTHFVVFSRRAILQCAAGLREIMGRPGGHELGGPMHVDGAYSTIRAQNPELKTYAYSPALGYQRASKTDIADTHWVDRRLAPLASVARKLKNLVS